VSGAIEEPSASLTPGRCWPCGVPRRPAHEPCEARPSSRPEKLALPERVLWATFFVLAGAPPPTGPYHWDDPPGQKDEEVSGWLSTCWSEGVARGLVLLRSRATPQPFGPYTQPLRLTNPAREALPKVGIACSFSPERMPQMIAGGRPPVGDRSGPGWRFVGLPTGDADFFNMLLPSTQPGEKGFVLGGSP
jgi:hypothetical protein